MTHDELRMLAVAYNLSHPKHAIPPRAFRTRKALIACIDDRLRQCHGDEACWLAMDWAEKDDGVKAAERSALRPRQPPTWRRNRSEWLSNFDILDVMHQYERRFRSFKFLDCTPIDFDSCSVSPALCKFDAAALAPKSQFGVVFNTDPHWKPGSHWVACYGNLNPRMPTYGVCYFDSNGHPPPPSVVRFMERVKATLPEESHARSRHRFRLVYSSERHQFRDSECGMFAMMFILVHLHSNGRRRPFESVLGLIGRDDDMHRMRDELFIATAAS